MLIKISLCSAFPVFDYNRTVDANLFAYLKIQVYRYLVFVETLKIWG